MSSQFEEFESTPILQEPDTNLLKAANAEMRQCEDEDTRPGFSCTQLMVEHMEDVEASSGSEDMPELLPPDGGLPVQSSSDERPLNLVESRESRRVNKAATKALIEREETIMDQLVAKFATELKIDGGELKQTAKAILDKAANAEMRQCQNSGSSINDAIRHDVPPAPPLPINCRNPY